MCALLSGREAPRRLRTSHPGCLLWESDALCPQVCNVIHVFFPSAAALMFLLVHTACVWHAECASYELFTLDGDNVQLYLPLA